MIPAAKFAIFYENTKQEEEIVGRKMSLRVNLLQCMTEIGSVIH